MVRRWMTVKARPWRGRRSRPARWRHERVIAQSRRHRLVYRGRWPVTVLAAVVTVAAIAVGAALGWIVAVVAGIAVVVAWLAYAIRPQRLTLAGDNGDWPDPPGAGVREPRRPLPKSPAGVAERARPA